MREERLLGELLGKQSLRAIFAMMGSVALLTLNDALIKSLAQTYPAGEVMFFRAAFIMPWIFLLAHHEGGLHTLRVISFRGQALRGVFVIGGTFLFINALMFLPLADAIAITFTGPIFITALAPLILRETVGWRRWVSVLAGFAGVLIMVRPGYSALQWAFLLPLGTALCEGFRDLITRRISQTEKTVAVLFFSTVVTLFAGLATAIFGWPPFRLQDLWIFALSGLLSAGAHYLIIEAFRLGEATLVAPFKYTSMVWAVLFGFLFFGDLPDLWTLVGAAIVILASMYILHRGTRFMRRSGGTIGPSSRL
jgi:drug/metabolite transporter (DMT)-like permease